MRSPPIAALVLTATFLLGSGQPAAASDDDELTDAQIARRIVFWRQQTWHWQRVLGKLLTPRTRGARSVTDHAGRLSLLRRWRQRAGRIWLRAKHPPHKPDWRCIQRYEGAWRSYPGGPGALDSGGPYYGGLQMDLEFQRTYGAYLLRTKGTANHWSPLEQMWVAERAHRTRGFYPWPNTARYCGLI